ncbi:hypothetical protein [Oceanirhabdus sp. W0125-5]|uniref:hypothetical protein n=1 Tax=Oceanirhabdus sp. W0125-5 TaxID=2999116 RepID=UPI0022F33441|nr:hypothetical protein [Oceanirhabdus sp. W0125-5]WBW96533.1 hypothetical protein OW730_22995 [Oceanirhabdus sp. W0125-5]
MSKYYRENRYSRNRANDMYDDYNELDNTPSTENCYGERYYNRRSSNSRYCEERYSKDKRCDSFRTRCGCESRDEEPCTNKESRNSKRYNCSEENQYKKEVHFWCGGAIQHIELLIGSNGLFGAGLSKEVKLYLDQLNNEFCYILELVQCYKSDSDKIVKRFLKVNSSFIKILNKIMFEEYLGSTELFELVNHFMIEQIYASRVFVDKKRAPQYKAKSCVLGPDFYEKNGLGETKLEIAYNTFYFWNIISAQQASILENIITYYNCNVPKKFYCAFHNFKRAYICLNKKSGEYFDTMSSIKLKSIGTDMLYASMQFLNFLYSLTPIEIGTFLPKDTPEAFFDFKEHVVEEQEYISQRLKRWIYSL